MFIKPLVVDFEGLQRMGWPYGPTHTVRLMSDTITVSEKVKGQKTRIARVIPNPDRFPSSFKLTSHRNGHRVWRISEVLAYFEARGLKVTDDWNAPDSDKE